MSTILIAEDDRRVRDSLERALGLEGYEVITANDGLAGLKAARANRPDLILMDMRMPELNGWEATRILKQEEATSAIPILALTAQTLESDLQRCWEAGVDEIIQKPVHLPVLIEMIGAHLVRQPEA